MKTIMNDLRDISRTLVDNWMLELAFSMFNDDYHEHIGQYMYDAIRTRQMLIEESNTCIQGKESKQELYSSIITALSHTLGLFVMCDELVHEGVRSYTWKRYNNWTSLDRFLNEIRIGHKTLEKIVPPYKTASFGKPLTWEDIIEGRALYYLNLSRLLGIYYWPSPRSLSENPIFAGPICHI